jgi:CRISPR-associated protein Cst1
LSIGAPLIGGKALVIGCDHPHILVEFARRWQPQIHKRVQLSMKTGQKLSPVARPLTRAVETLEEICEHIPENGVSVTVYQLSNSGQGPDIKINFLSPVVVSFFRRTLYSQCRDIWDELVTQAWGLPLNSTTQKSPDRSSLRNSLYESLYGLPESARQFVRIYFRRNAVRILENGKALKDFWNLVDLFLQEIVAMDAVRVETVKNVGDALAAEICKENDQKLWQDVYRADNYRAVRSTLIRGNKRRIDRGTPPLITFDGFLGIFEDAVELPRTDWRLAWDLIVIRVIDNLFQRKWFDKNQDVLAEDQQDDKVEAQRWPF